MPWPCFNYKHLGSFPSKIESASALTSLSEELSCCCAHLLRFWHWFTIPWKLCASSWTGYLRAPASAHQSGSGQTGAMLPAKDCCLISPSATILSIHMTWYAIPQPKEDPLLLFFFPLEYFFFLYCSGFCHTLKWNSHGFTCVPHPHPPSHLPLHSIPLGLPSAPGPSACLMHPTWAGDLKIPHF